MQMIGLSTHKHHRTGRPNRALPILAKTERRT
jgi:hypothetical protein